MTLVSEFLKNFVLISSAIIAAFLVALWLAIIFWVFRDIRSRSSDPFMWILSLLLVIILNIPGVVIYWIIRPNKTIEQKYHEALEEEALLGDMEKQLKCPGCARKIEECWVVCPACHTRLKKLCVNCGKPLELPWTLCPYCGVPQQKPYNPINTQKD